MKKLFLFFSAILCFLSGYSQTLQETAEVISGSEVVLTVRNESGNGYMTSIIIMMPTSVITPTGTSIQTTTPEAADYGYPIKPTSFKFKVTGHFLTPATPITAKLTIKCVLADQVGGNSRTVENIVTITVKPPVQTVYQNQARSKVFTRNNCGPGFTGGTYSYTVPANKFTASSQQEANALADADILANGQIVTNQKAQCLPLFYNTAQTATFSKNNCVGNSSSGPPVPFTIPQGEYSATSQAEADALAQAALATRGQAYANSQITCIPFVFYTKLIMENVKNGPDPMVAYTTADFSIGIYADAALTIPLAIAPTSISVPYQEVKTHSAINVPQTTTRINRTATGRQGQTVIWLGTLEIVNCPPVPDQNSVLKTSNTNKGPIEGPGTGGYPCITRTYELL